MSKIWITADTHFGHEELPQLERGLKPDFERRIARGLVDDIHLDDTVLHLGDVCIGKDAYHHAAFLALTQCRCAVLIRGNHDKKSRTWYMNCGWHDVCDEWVLELYGWRLRFTHEPLRRLEHYEVNIHGHLHASRSSRTGPRHILYSQQAFHYRPALLRTLMKGRTK